MNTFVTITGRLGHNPELRHTKAGKAVCDLKIAFNEKVKRGAGYVDSVTWHRIVLWQGLAEDARSLRKGSTIRVEGFQRSRTFKGRDGVTRTVVELVAEKLTALDSVQSETRSSTTSVSDQPEPRNGVHNRSESVPKPYSQPAANGNRPTNSGVPRAQIPGSEWDSV